MVMVSSGSKSFIVVATMIFRHPSIDPKLSKVSPPPIELGTVGPEVKSEE